MAMRQVQRMAQNPSFPWVPSQGTPVQEDRNESPHQRRLRAVFSAFEESGAGSTLALDILIHELAEEALSIPGVTGSAIALRGAGDHFACRAVAGEPTPALGSRIEAQDGLSAQCVRTGRLQVCQDTELDARLNAEMCRAWGVRSLVIVPLFLRQRLIGILEVFSPISDAFNRPAIERLVQLGNYVVETVAFSEGGVRPASTVAARPAAPFRSRTETWIDTQLPEGAQAPRVSLPEVAPTVSGYARADAGPEPAFSYATGSDAANVIPPQPGAATMVFPAAVFPPPGVLTPPAQRRNLGLALMVLAAGLVAVVGLWSWWPAAASKPTLASTIASQVPRVIDPSKPASSSNPERTLSSQTAKPSPSSKKTSPVLPKNSSGQTSHTGGLVVYENGKVVYRAVPGSGSMIGPTTVEAGAPRAAASGPVTAASETEKLRDTAEGGTISGGRLIHQVDPVMPPELAGWQLPDEVLLEGVIARDGSVRDLHLLRGDARLAEAAIVAARQWRYEPFRSNGERVDMLATLSVRFR
jgi:hypothetical protein